MLTIAVIALIHPFAELTQPLEIIEPTERPVTAQDVSLAIYPEIEPKHPVEAKNEATSTPDTCLCVTYARRFIPDLPRQNAEDFQPNSTPVVGGLALFKYSSGLYHVAYIKGVYENGVSVLDANYTHCKETERFIPWDYPALRGFWKGV